MDASGTSLFIGDRAHPSRWACPRCAHGEGRLGEAALPSNPLAALAEVETRWFTTATCRRCAYTEFYDAPAADVLASWAPTLSDVAPR